MEKKRWKGGGREKEREWSFHLRNVSNEAIITIPYSIQCPIVILAEFGIRDKLDFIKLIGNEMITNESDSGWSKQKESKYFSHTVRVVDQITNVRLVWSVRSFGSTNVTALLRKNGPHSPMIQIGFRMNRSRPQQPMYFDLQPALHSRTRYSTPKNTTRHISWTV